MTMEPKSPVSLFEMQGFFFGVILGIDAGMASRGGKPMDYKDDTVDFFSPYGEDVIVFKSPYVVE